MKQEFGDYNEGIKCYDEIIDLKMYSKIWNF